MDDFICDDDEVEYMDGDKKGVISLETPDDELEDDLKELTAMHAHARLAHDVVSSGVSVGVPSLRIREQNAS